MSLVPKEPAMSRLLLASSLLVALCSCKATVRPTVSPADFAPATNPVPGEIALVVSEDLRTFTGESGNWLDFKTWIFEVGPCTVDAFRYALEERFSSVRVVPEEATLDAAEDSPRPVLARIEPEIVAFDGDEPWVFKFETYAVDLRCRVRVRDAEGRLLYERDYDARGTKRGSVGFESAGHAAHPEAYREAVLSIVRQVADDLVGAVAIEG